ncbi:MAG: cytochrome c biogenesis protein ResB [Planctomycetota bacterium]
MNGTNRSPGARVLDVLGSFGLCCVLLLCLFVLTVLGTLYQVDHGLYAAKARFFSSWFLWWQPTERVSLPVFPGGITCMLVLAANMLVGGLYRVRFDSRRAGVVIVHLGIAFLLIAGLVKMLSAVEGHLTLYEGEQADYFQSYHDWEVAVWEVGGAQPGREHVIDDPLLRDLEGGRSRTFVLPGLPFELVLSDFVPNSRVLPKGPRWTAVGPVVDGFALQKLSLEKEAEQNIAGLHVAVRDGGAVQRGILWGLDTGTGPDTWTFRAGDRDWAVRLGHARYPMPFSIRLDDFEKEDHPGISMAKAFRSRVTKLQAGTTYASSAPDGRAEPVLIQMNEPLRDGGLVLFQSSWGPGNAGPRDRLFSVFSVVRNPSDRWPELSLWVITAGLLLAFGRKLFVTVRAQIELRGAAERTAA